jgi:hypothetical protein
MAWATLRDEGAFVVEAKHAPRSAARVILSGILINILNPKLTIFFFAFLPQFVHADEPDALPRMVGLSGIFMLVTLVVFVIYGVFAAAARSRVLTRPGVLTWARRLFAGSFAALAGRLAFADRQRRSVAGESVLQISLVEPRQPQAALDLLLQAAPDEETRPGLLRAKPLEHHRRA